MRRACLFIAAFLILLLCGCAHKETPKDQNNAEKVVWEKGSDPTNILLLYEMLEPEEGEEVRILYQNLPSLGEKEVILSFQEGKYHLTGDGEREYAHLLRLSDQNHAFYVLTDEESISFRDFWRNVWQSPDEREISLYVLCWKGESVATDEAQIAGIRDEDLLQAAILAGLDEQVIPWGLTMEQLQEAPLFHVRMQSGAVQGGLNFWDAFVKQSRDGETCRVVILQEEAGQETLIQICFAGEFYDPVEFGEVKNTGLDLTGRFVPIHMLQMQYWTWNFRYIVANWDRLGGYKAYGYWLSTDHRGRALEGITQSTRLAEKGMDRAFEIAVIETNSWEMEISDHLPWTEEEISRECIFVYLAPELDESEAQDHFREIKLGLEDALTAKGADVSTSFSAFSCGWDVEVQQKQLAEAIDQKVNVIFISPAALDPLQTLVTEAVEAGIYVIAIDIDMELAESADFAGCICDDMKEMGEEAAVHVADGLAEEGKIAILHSAVSLRESALQAMTAKLQTEVPQVEIIVDEVLENDSVAAAKAFAEKMLREKDLDKIVVATSNAAVGCAEAIKEAGKENEVKVIGFMQSYAVNHRIVAGDVSGCMFSFPGEMGIQAVEQIYRLLMGEPIEYVIVIPTVWGDQSNVAVW
ncbi:MAG: sugar ABC transporter substrate-binding protein [Lachnospiraceae bacterium]|nr:sugar ABC transporter substrate-binding protein [Lachnospiraceae bacterium]